MPPLYDYKCDKCGKMTEVMLTIHETLEGEKCKEKKCTGCLKQHISGCNVHIAANHKADYLAGK